MPVKRGRRAKYPWESWLGKKGDTQEFRRDIHFFCEPHSFAIQVRQAAKRASVRVSVGIVGDHVGITNLGKRN